MRLQEEKTIDIFALGNALVDIPTSVSDAFLQDLGLHKGSMTLIDEPKRTAILNKLGNQTLAPKCGGSAANTVIAVAQSGGTGHFVGKVSSDDMGAVYVSDLIKNKIGYTTPKAESAKGPTGTSIILTTPDAERTMCTHLGVSVQLSPEDIDCPQLDHARYCYVEGYLWSNDVTRAACIKVFEEARKRGAKTAFTFSDLFLVDLFSEDFIALTREHCDLVFCNAEEARKLCQVESLRACALQLGGMVRLAFITDGKEGCLVVDNGKVTPVPGFAVNAIDTVGAGDAFAGGVIYALARGHSPVSAAKWGNFLASEVVKVRGPRAEYAHASRIQEVIG